MTFVPQANIPGTYYAMRVRNLTARTQLPHVQLDIACDTTATLEIPWVGPVQFWQLYNNNGFQPNLGDLGRLALWIYSPLKTGTGVPDQVSYTIWVHFEDIELVCPTYPQSNNATIRGNKPPSEREKPTESLSHMLRSLALGAGSSVIPTLSAAAAAPSWVASVAASSLIS